MNELTHENATHLLSCAHQVGWRNGKPNARREYTMRCHVLKDMGDGRFKILVFGERNWKYKEHISRVRYVPKSRLTKRATDAANVSAQIDENVKEIASAFGVPAKYWQRR